MGHSKNSIIISIFLAMYLLAAGGLTADKNYFPSFADEHTVGMWLFDENEYPYTTITDAGQHESDLRLMKGGRIVKGKYGNCLKCTPGDDLNVSYAALKGAVSFVHMREASGKPGSGLYGPTIAPEKMLKAFADSDGTCEFWLLLMSNPIQDVKLIDIGNKYEPGFTITLKKSAKGFELQNAYAGFEGTCPTVLEQIWGRAWHHIAFVYSAKSKSLEYYIDGAKQQPVKISGIEKANIIAAVRPMSIANTTYGIFEKEKRDDVPDYEKRRSQRFNFALGHDRKGNYDFNGNIDELRISDVIRYNGDFPLPDSFSRNYNRNAPEPPVANGPPLLFGADKTYLPNEPVMLGSRKHLFIDEVMLDRMENVKLVINQPKNPVKLNEQVAWDASFIEHQGKIYTVVSEGYEGDEAPISLLVSQDGVNFEKPNLGLIAYKGFADTHSIVSKAEPKPYEKSADTWNKNNNLVMLGVPSWGKYFKDTNPACPAEELFKATLWVAQRGIYLYFSPDMIHWRRNETCMLPLVSGGGCETFWDDQQGRYFNYLKRDGSYNTGDFPAYGRGTTMFSTKEINKAWPFDPVPNPYYEGWAFPAVTGEGLTVFGPDVTNPNKGQVFRSRPQKYEWAPDTYVAFLLRNGKADLAVSRDAVNWTLGSEKGLGYYWDAMISNGIIKRGNNLWQWGNTGEGRGLKSCLLTQRLDGFTALQAGEQKGTVITRPFIYKGGKLTLNVDAGKGSVKVALLDLTGRELTSYAIALSDDQEANTNAPGFRVKDCDTITTDSVRHVVTWKGISDVGNFAGQVVRLRFEMQNAKIFAMQFE